MINAQRFRLVVVLVVAFGLSGCSRAVVIPREQIDDPLWRKPGTYRIRLDGREEYIARRFSVTDSTVVIEELHPSDERYRSHRVELPTSIPAMRVQSIERLEFNRGLTLLVATPALLFVGLVVLIAAIDPIYAD